MNERERISEEVEKLGGWQAFYGEADRAGNPNGLRRLVHLVPEVAPDQESLARILAEYALHIRRNDLVDHVPLVAYQRYERATSEGINRLVREARNKKSKDAWIAWQACELFLDPNRRSYIDGTEKKVKPIPEPIQLLMQDHFRGNIDRPKPKKTGPNRAERALRNDAIRFAVWMALEANMPATSRNKVSACGIVGELLGMDGVAEIWKERIHKPPRNART